MSPHAWVQITVTVTCQWKEIREGKERNISPAQNADLTVLAEDSMQPDKNSAKG